MLNLNRSRVGRDDASRLGARDEARARRTRIEDLSQFGDELPEERLRLVIGGGSAGTFGGTVASAGSAGTCCEPGMCDDD